MDFKEYPSYKDSGVEWIGKVPEHWDVKPLKYLFSIKNGATPKSNVSEFWDGDIKWVTPSDLSKLESHEIAESSRTITVEGFNSCGTNLVPAGSIIVSCRAPIGSLAITSTSLCTNQGCKSLIASKLLNIKFYFYYLSISSDKLNSLGNGTTFLELSSFELKNLSILAPRLEEQTKIVSFLDSETSRIDNLIAKQEKLIEKLEEHRKSVISHAVTKGLDPNVPMKDSGVEWLGEVPEHWKYATLKRVLHILTDYTANGSFGDLAKNVTYLDEGFSRLVRLTDLRENLINKGIYVSQNAHTYLKKSELFGGEVLLANVGAYAGFACLMPSLNIKATLAPNMFLLRFKKNVDNDFMHFYLNSKFAQTQFQMQMTSTAQPKLNKDNVKSIVLFIPNIDEQINIVEFIKFENLKIDKLISKQKQLINRLKEYRKSIISHAVTGKIDVRDLIA